MEQDLFSALTEAAAVRDQVAVPEEKAAVVQEFFERDDLGGGMTPEERQELLQRNGLAPAAPQAPAPVAAPAVSPVQAAPVVAPVTPPIAPAPVAPVHQGPTPEQIALAAQTRAVMEALQAIKTDLVQSRQPPAKKREEMTELEGLRYDLVQEARASMQEEANALKAELQALKQAKIEADRQAELNRNAHYFQAQAQTHVGSTLHAPELVDPSLLTPQDAEVATELVLTAGAGYGVDAQQAAAIINKLIAREVELREKTRIMRTQPVVQRQAAAPPVVPAGQPATGMPRRVPTNQEIAKAGYRDRWEASRDNYRRVQPSA